MAVDRGKGKSKNILLNFYFRATNDGTAGVNVNFKKIIQRSRMLNPEYCSVKIIINTR
jgi:hypothetical protein